VSIGWSTNQVSSSEVYYGLSTPYTSNTPPDGTMTTSHVQLLTGLNPTTTYHFRVESRNSGGGVATSADGVFNTPAPETAPLMGIDAPANNAIVAVPFDISGWAIDRNAASGTGVDGVQIWATPTSGGTAIFVGTATYGSARTDITALYGASFSRSGFFLWVQNMAPGTYQLSVYAHNARLGTYQTSRSNVVTVTGAPQAPSHPGKSDKQDKGHGPKK
jgi:hypothetical protein